MAGIDTRIEGATHYADINELLDILSDEARAFYWPWAEELMIQRAEKMKFFEDKNDLLTAVMRRFDSTSLEHFEKIKEKLELMNCG